MVWIVQARIREQFDRAFGVSVAQYRATARARNAYQALMQSDVALIDIADQFDFSDQAHFTRSIRALTGAPPHHWRQVRRPMRQR